MAQSAWGKMLLSFLPWFDKMLLWCLKRKVFFLFNLEAKFSDISLDRSGFRIRSLNSSWVNNIKFVVILKLRSFRSPSSRAVSLISYISLFSCWASIDCDKTTEWETSSKSGKNVNMSTGSESEWATGQWFEGISR